MKKSFTAYYRPIVMHVRVALKAIGEQWRAERHRKFVEEQARQKRAYETRTVV